MPIYLRRRLGFLVVLLLIALAILVGRLASVQVVQGAELEERALEMRTGRLALPLPPRGKIQDRNGLPLVANELWYEVGVNPPLVDDPEFTAERLGPILQVPSSALLPLLESEQTWVRLDPDVTAAQGEAVEALGLDELNVQRRWLRQYPHGSTAAHVLGFVNRYGQGFYGLEGYYDRVLQGQVSVWEGETGPSGRWPLPAEEGDIAPPLSGTDLTLTLDLAVQAMVEEELDRALAEFGARGGTVIVMDPRTGAILALASRPAFDPNRYEQYLFAGEESLFLSPAYGTQYEPGSVFKIITVAAALDSGTASPDWTYYDTGEYNLGGQRFQNWDRRAYGQRGLVDLLGLSLNVGAVTLAVDTGPAEFYRYVQMFGFGEPTGVDLEGEWKGRLRVPEDLNWYEADLGANSFGQGVAATPLQVVSAVAAVANGGRLMKPYLVARQTRPDGTLLQYQPVVRGQPISPETAQVVAELLAQAVEQHIPQAQVEGYRIGGKTGTSQIPIAGGYDRRWTITSFVGFGPLPDPQLIILVRLDQPTTSEWGSETAVLVFQRLATRLLPMLGIAPGE